MVRKRPLPHEGLHVRRGLHKLVSGEGAGDGAAHRHLAAPQDGAAAERGLVRVGGVASDLVSLRRRQGEGGQAQTRTDRVARVRVEEQRHALSSEDRVKTLHRLCCTHFIFEWDIFFQFP